MLHRIFNVYPHEVPRVMICWSIRLIYRLAFILAWTTVLSLFAAHFEISKLPFLFIGHAFLFIMGSFIYMHFIQKFHLDRIIMFVLFASIVVLIGAGIAVNFSFYIYLLLLLFVEAFFLIQLTVAFDTFNERFFTPLESQRTFPLVESADTIAGIIGGIIFIYFSSVFPMQAFVWIIIGLICLMVPFLIYFRIFARSTPGIKFFSHDGKKTLTKNISSGIKIFKQHSFAKNLTYIILLQYAFLILVEFIYTGSVAVFSHGQAALPDTAMGMENTVAHTFGILQLVFSGASLIMQVAIGGRLITNLGIIGSMTIYPAVMLLNLAGLIMRFGFFTSALTKISSEITSVISRNAYQSSYYAFREEESEEVRQLIDGMVRPLGTMVGAVLLIFTQLFISSPFLNLAIVCIMFVLIIIDMVIVSGTQTLYTANTVSALLCKNEDVDERLKSVDILIQKGHGEIEPALMKCLSDPVSPDLLKIKIIKALTEFRYFESLPEITGFTTHPNREVRIAAIEAIESFQEADYFSKNEFSKMKIFEMLKSVFWKESEEDIRIMILNIISKFTGEHTVNFITDILQNEKGEVLAEAIRSLCTTNDISLAELLEDYLYSQDKRLVFSACIGLWQFPKYRTRIKKILGEMLQSADKLACANAAYAIGEIGIEDYKNKLISIFKKEKDSLARAHIAISLLKLGSGIYINFLIDILRDHSHPLSYKLIKLINEIPERYKNLIDPHIFHAASYKIHKIFGKSKTHKISDMQREELNELRYCYHLLNSTSDILRIDAILKKKSV